MRPTPPHAMSSNSYQRILELHAMLKSGQPVTLRSITEQCELHPRTAQRLIELMRDRLRAPIAYSRQRKAYHYMDETFELPAAFMTSREGVAVALAFQARLQQDLPLGDHLVSGIQKFYDLLSRRVTIDLDELLHRVTFTPHPSRPVEGKVLDAITDALDRSESLQMEYFTASRNELTEREVDPYHLTNRRGDWYMVGYCHLRHGLRTFAASRIRRIRPSGRSYRIPRSFDVEAWFRNTFGVIPGGPPEKVVLAFNADQARWIREREWHSGQVLRDLPDGGVRLEMTVGISLELRAWILSYGADVRVLEPASLRRDVAARLQAAAAQYE